MREAELIQTAIQFKQTLNLTGKPMWRLTHIFGKGSETFGDINEEEEEGELVFSLLIHCFHPMAPVFHDLRGQSSWNQQNNGPCEIEVLEKQGDNFS